MFCDGVKTVNTSQKASVGIMKNGKTPFPEMHVAFLTIQRKPVNRPWNRSINALYTRILPRIRRTGSKGKCRKVTENRGECGEKMYEKPALFRTKTGMKNR